MKMKREIMAIARAMGDDSRYAVGLQSIEVTANEESHAPGAHVLAHGSSFDSRGVPKR